MASERHISEQLSAWLDGRLDAAQAEEVAGHLAACAPCAEERDLLRDGQALLGKLPAREPRVGFAFQVAQAAAAQQHGRASAFWRWTFGGLAGAAVAAGLLLAVLPKQRGDGAEGSHELMLAQRLELYEDLGVLQNREALENLDVVEHLDKLELGKP